MNNEYHSQTINGLTMLVLNLAAIILAVVLFIVFVIGAAAAETPSSRRTSIC